MISLRQLEAFVWTVRLGTLSRGAERLNIAQPTISKRIQELQATCRFTVFRKLGRSVELTPQGHELYKLAEQMMAIAERIDTIRNSEEQLRRKVAIGVTELTAHTWLPRMLNQLTAAFPTMEPHVTIGHGAALLASLARGNLDFVICSVEQHDPQICVLPLARVQMAVLGSPRLCEPTRLYDGLMLSALPFLTHGVHAGSVGGLRRWMDAIGAAPTNVIEVDSIAAQVGMAIAGLGVTLLPPALFRSLIDGGKLIELDTAVPPPTVDYAIAYRTHDQGSFIESLARSAVDACDFGTTNQI